MKKLAAFEQGRPVSGNPTYHSLQTNWRIGGFSVVEAANLDEALA